jgi:5-hydroxyisourate hydrolase-like protein (transthyretin family)
MKSIHVIFLSIALIATVSCKKKNSLFSNTTIVGRVTNKATGKPIENLTVFLYYRQSGNMIIPSSERLIKKRTTNENGEYDIKFWAKGDRSHEIEVVPDDYYKEYKLVKNQESQTINFELIPKSVLKFKIKNVSPYNKEDRIYLRTKSSQYEGLNQEYEFIGMNVDTTIYAVVNGYYPVGFLGSYTKNNVKTEFKNSVICASPGCEYIINY